ncbi:13551_t:CDS:1 [Acaulospora morrowiae]|uniref:13551_t:CDS:1 n=1 Tax=Acaulospora morrowiae TaxID=94023 RepID=A0A9N9EXE9_9GLOM|nr:13551_t:CDS:1 [Acaulospora morrowiae]
MINSNFRLTKRQCRKEIYPLVKELLHKQPGTHVRGRALLSLHISMVTGKLGLSYSDKKISQYIWKYCLKWKERVSYMEGKNLSDDIPSNENIGSQVEKISLAFTQSQAQEFLDVQPFNVPPLQEPRINDMITGITF